MSEPSAEQAGGVLAAPTRRARHLALASVAGAALALALAAAGVIIAINVHRGAALIATLASPPGSHGASSAAFSPNGKTLAILDGDGSTQLWDVAARRVTTTLTSAQCRGGESQVLFSPDGSLLAVVGSARTCLWDLTSRRQIATVTTPSNSENAVGAVGGAFSPDGKTLAIADSNGSTYLWGVTTRSLVATLNDPGGDGENPSVAGIAFSPDGSTLAAADADGSTYLWNLTTRWVTATLNDPVEGPYLDSGGPESTAFASDGALAVGDGDGQIYVWDTATQSVTATLTPPINVLEANSYYYSPDADVAGQVEGGGGPIGVTVAFSSDGDVLAAGVDYGYGVCVWDSAGRHQIASVTDPGGDNSEAPPLALSPDGSLLAVVDPNGRTYVWRVG
jgi:WD40 repeat protein